MIDLEYNSFYITGDSEEGYSVYNGVSDLEILSEVTAQVALDFFRFNNPMHPAVHTLSKVIKESDWGEEGGRVFYDDYDYGQGGIASLYNDVPHLGYHTEEEWSLFYDTGEYCSSPFQDTYLNYDGTYLNSNGTHSHEADLQLPLDFNKEKEDKWQGNKVFDESPKMGTRLESLEPDGSINLIQYNWNHRATKEAAGLDNLYDLDDLPDLDVD